MKFFSLILIALILFSVSAYAEKNPVRIAKLPIIFRSTMPDYDTRDELEIKFVRATHIPMNKTLQAAEYLPSEISTQALNEIWQKIHSENKKARLSAAMKPLAENLDADIIICPILHNYNQYVDNFSGFGEIFLHSEARVELIIYDRRTDNLIDKKAAQWYHDVMSTTGTADYLAKICFDKVIDETKLRQLIMTIGK